MQLNPTLKNALVRTGCIVGSLAIYIKIMQYLGHLEFEADYDWQFTLYAIVRFVVPLLLVWLNVRKLAKPVRCGFTALFVLACAVVTFIQRVEPTAWNRYYTTLYIVGLTFVTLAALLPIWLRNVQAERLSKCSKVLVWTAALLMDFAVAMPSIWSVDSNTYGVYVGQVRVTNTKHRTAYAFAAESFGGFNDIVDVNVMTPDSLGVYTNRIYRHALDSDYMVDTLTRDTIWICEHGVRYDPNRKTMENLELAALRHQWQYDMWHRLKRIMGKKRADQADLSPMKADESSAQERVAVTRIQDSVRFAYIEPVEGYQVSGVLTEYFDKTDVAFVELNFRHCKTGKEFAVSGGHVSWQYFLGVDSVPSAPVRLHYPEIAKDGIITAPDNTPFFFADIDFDGKTELIAGNSAFAGTQRGVGRYTDIYKIVDGRPQDATEAFKARSSVFDCMDEYCFSVNPARKELIYWHDGGAIDFGWEVHKFDKGEYRYDRYVSCFNPRDDSVRVAILTPQHDTLKTFTVDKATFDKKMWNY